MSCFLNASSHHEDGVGDQTTRASSSSTPIPRQNYEVFLSFRGEDTRRGFADHLYHRLVDKGILVFRDSEDLHVGEKIDQLFEAIKASKISIPIISPDYPSSIWCLKELLQILECRETLGQLVFPIFYRVKPSDVREQRGNFGEKFRLCKRKHALDGKFVEELEKAFKKVATLKGWESDQIADGHEGELVKMVVTRIFNELGKAVLVVPDFMVGVEDRVKEIKKIIGTRPFDEAKIIAIHGMGGIGKTTLAKVLYNALSNDFECHSFVPNIREGSKNEGMKALQKQMISDILIDKSSREISHVDEGITIIKKSFKGKRLLLCLDDVENKDQLNELVVENNLFGSESVVIITTRNKDVTVASQVNLSYEVSELNMDQSYELFCKHAFERDESCPMDLEPIARKIIWTTGGLPLALEVIGSLLHEKDKDIWEETLERLRRIPNEKVRDKLRISYDYLEHGQQQIFLDIACLRDMYDPMTGFSSLEYASWVWKSCGFYPKEGIERLISLSLIKRNADHRIIMHDQLRDLGREIVYEEGRDNIGCCSRLWQPEEAREVIETKRGTPNVQVLDLEGPSCLREPIHYISQQFEGMTNLRFLKMWNVFLTGDFENHFPNLRWLLWGAYSKSPAEIDIMGINFNPKKLVILLLYSSKISEHWKGWNHMKCLKVLKLFICERITTTPDFSVMKELEVLILVQCSNLRKIHPSIGKLSKTLKFLDVTYCKELEELPIEMGKMEELRELNISHTAIREIPISEGYMKKLETLHAIDCRQLISIPNSIGSLVKPQCLGLRGCTSLTKLPESIGKLKPLIRLDMTEAGVKELPDSIGELSNLKFLDLSRCKELESVSKLPSSLTCLHLCGDLMDTLPDFSILTNLEQLNYVDLFEKRNRVLNLGNVSQLQTLSVQQSARYFFQKEQSCMAPKNISLQLVLPISLVKLEIYGCQTLYTLPNLSNLKNLSSLCIVDCFKLMEILGLEGAKSLARLVINGCKELSRLGDLSHLKMLRELHLWCCENLSDVLGIENLTSLTHLSFSYCHPTIKFQDLSMLRNLKSLTIKDEKLIEIPGLQELKSLENLDISGCMTLRYLPDLSPLTILKIMDARACKQLTTIEGIENLTSLKTLNIRGCTRLEGLSHLAGVNVASGPLEMEKDWEFLSNSLQSINSVSMDDSRPRNFKAFILKYLCLAGTKNKAR